MAVPVAASQGVLQAGAQTALCIRFDDVVIFSAKRLVDCEVEEGTVNALSELEEAELKE